MEHYYQNEYVTLYNDSCLAHVDERRVSDTVITDPPYNMDYKYGSYKDVLPIDEYYHRLSTVCFCPSVTILYPEMLFPLSWEMEEIPEKVVAWVYPSNTPKQWRGIAWWGITPDFSKAGQPY
ncbi:MAG: hypothetical protein GF364_05030, partial [Candidatus Lokiarchaeota archaeon]|nr:hypothetical protein [Candidatus Lokiarchaeota archaeon]